MFPLHIKIVHEKTRHASYLNFNEKMKAVFFTFTTLTVSAKHQIMIKRTTEFGFIMAVYSR